MPSLSSSNTVKIHVQTDADTKGVDQTEESLGRLDQASKRGNSSLVALGAAAKLAGVGLLAAGAGFGAGAVAGFKFNSSVEQAEAQIMAFTKSGEKTAEILKYVKDEAAKTQFSFTDMAQAAGGLIPASKQSGIALKDLIREAEILAALNPAEGLVGAAFSLKEALSGDFVSIVERFNLPRKRLNELKEQGVPALQAIQTALREMGIDYDLVAKQGETTAARWDQLKDKFTMLAGEYSKPIFDKVSKALDGLPDKIDKTKVSYESLIAGFKGEVPAKLDDSAAKFFQLGEKIKGVYNLVSDFLKPSIDQLVASYNDNLAPALERLKPYLDDVARIIGVLLVAAIWLAINTIRFLIDMTADMINRFVTTAQVTRNVIDVMVGGFRWFGDTVGGIMWTVGNTIKNAFNGAYEFVKTLPEKMVGLFTGLGGSIRNVIGNIDIPGPLGKIKDVIPGFEAGGFTGRGSSDEVAGVVHRGEYVVPKSQVDQSTGLPKAGGGGGVNMNIVQNFYTKADYERGNAELGYRLGMYA